MGWVGLLGEESRHLGSRRHVGNGATPPCHASALLSILCLTHRESSPHRPSQSTVLCLDRSTKQVLSLCNSYQTGSTKIPIESFPSTSRQVSGILISPWGDYDHARSQSNILLQYKLKYNCCTSRSLTILHVSDCLPGLILFHGNPKMISAPRH